MTFTIEADWWLLPLFITVAAFVWAFWADRDNHPGPYGAGAIVSLALFAAAIIVSLVSWLIWSIIT